MGQSVAVEVASRGSLATRPMRQRLVVRPGLTGLWHVGALLQLRHADGYRDDQVAGDVRLSPVPTGVDGLSADADIHSVRGFRSRCAHWT